LRKCSRTKAENKRRKNLQFRPQNGDDGEMATRFETTDVVVIGAGVSGLAAARHVMRSGRSVLVLEADRRVGGRLRTHRLADGTAYDLGGQWIAPPDEMPRINALLKEFGLETFHQVNSARMDLTAHKIEDMSRLMQAEWEWFVAKLEALAESVNEDSLSLTPDATALDAVSVEEWKRANLGSEALKKVFDQIVRTEYTLEPKDVSMLYFLHGIKTSGGLDAMFSSDGGSHSLRVVDGLAAVCTHMAEELGDRLLLGYQVYDVIHRGDGVRVVAENAIIEADHVIVALPPNQIQRLDFDPVLPRRRMWLMQRLEMGSVIKCFAFYNEPFWRGRAVTIVDPELIVLDHTLDASSADDKHYALVAFIGGDDAVVWSDKSAEERKAMVLDGLARVLGEEARSPIDYFDHDWLTEPFIGGGYSCYAPPGVMTSGYEELSHSIGPIHWAGTEMATTYGGYVEGALEAAERAATEVLDALFAPAAFE
jgi:monoamine oxidase